MNSPQTFSQFAAFLRSYPDKTPVAELRKTALKACLDFFGAQRVIDLTDAQRADIETALTIPCVPASVNTMLSIPEPGPAFSMAHVGRIVDDTGASSDVAIVFLEARAEDTPLASMISRVHAKMLNGKAEDSIPRLNAATLTGKMASTMRKIEAEDAAARGELWVIRAAIYQGMAVIHVQKTDDTTDMTLDHSRAEREFEAEFPEAFAYAHNPFIGSRTGAMTKAATLLILPSVSITVVE